MKIEQVSVTKVKGYPKNARKHSKRQVNQIAASIREFGFNSPVLIDENSEIIAGHGRLEAAKQLDLKQVPCIRLSHLDESKKKAFRLADNRLMETGDGWDEELLKIELEELAAEEIDLDLMGFDDFDFSQFDENHNLDVEPKIDQAKELQAQWGVEPGQLWELGNHKILCGDATNQKDVELLLGGNKELIMVTDPPYGVNYNADWRNHIKVKSRTGCAIGKVQNDDQADWKMAWDLFPGDVAYVWHAGILTHIVAESLIGSGLEIIAQIIWAKNKLVVSRGNYHWQHEPCWYAVRKGGKRKFTKSRKQTTLWEIDKPMKSETGHSTQKPVECMARAIRNHGFEYVYDPFVGSGTTIIACEQLSKKCLAIEISPAYVAVCIQRWVDMTGIEPKVIQE